MKQSLFILALFLIMWIVATWLNGCIQHELEYNYLLIDPNSIHAENLHYKQNVFVAKTDKVLTEAAFADVIKLKMARSLQAPDPNAVKAVTEGVVGAIVGGGL